MKKSVAFLKAKKLRRICADIIDLIIVLVLAIICYLFVEPIVNSTSFYKENLARHTEICVNSGLFYETEDGTSHIITENIDQKLSEFLTNYTANGIDYYNNLKIESGLFDSNYVVLTTATDDELNTFYKESLNDICTSEYFTYYLTNNYGDVSGITNAISVCNTLKLLISVLLGLIVYLIPMPLIRKDGLTFGKMVYKLKIYSNKGDLTASKLQILFSNLIFIFEIILSCYTLILFYVPLFLLISLVMVLFTSGAQTLHDSLCSLIVVADEPIQNNTRESDKIILTIVEDDK